MTIQKTLAVAMVLAAATSCIGPTVVAWRGIVHFNQQEATTDGLTLIDCPADGADFRGAHWED